MPILDRDEYVEQAFLFESALERLKKGEPMQEILGSVRDEVLTTTKLPMALDFLAGELKHVGKMSSAMARLGHYFSPFQTYVVHESEAEEGRFDIRTAFQVLMAEAKLRSKSTDTAATFFFQFEALCRNRLSYDRGVAAIAQDPIFDESWSKWIMKVRTRIESVGLADLVYVASEYYLEKEQRRSGSTETVAEEILFGVKEGKIALANRRREPLRFFEALQRQLGYPPAPRNLPTIDPAQQLTQLLRRMERLETRVKMIEDENREGAVDLSKFYRPRDQS